MRLLALLAILWAGTWLLLIVVPGGAFPAVDRGYGLMVMPFAASGAGGVVQRLVEFVCLLPAAVFLVMAQAVQKRRHNRGGQARWNALRVDGSGASFDCAPSGRAQDEEKPETSS